MPRPRKRGGQFVKGRSNVGRRAAAPKVVPVDGKERLTVSVAFLERLWEQRAGLTPSDIVGATFLEGGKAPSRGLAREEYESLSQDILAAGKREHEAIARLQRRRRDGFDRGGEPVWRARRAFHVFQWDVTSFKSAQEWQREVDAAGDRDLIDIFLNAGDSDSDYVDGDDSGASGGDGDELSDFASDDGDAAAAAPPPVPRAAPAPSDSDCAPAGVAADAAARSPKRRRPRKLGKYKATRDLGSAARSRRWRDVANGCQDVLSNNLSALAGEYVPLYLVLADPDGGDSSGDLWYVPVDRCKEPSCRPPEDILRRLKVKGRCPLTAERVQRARKLVAVMDRTGMSCRMYRELSMVAPLEREYVLKRARKQLDDEIAAHLALTETACGARADFRAKLLYTLALLEREGTLAGADHITIKISCDGRPVRRDRKGQVLLSFSVLNEGDDTLSPFHVYTICLWDGEEDDAAVVDGELAQVREVMATLRTVSLAGVDVPLRWRLCADMKMAAKILGALRWCGAPSECRRAQVSIP